ncbi:unnamed protein product [Leptidea sinapis]|uniref:Uncharacterized protein n=1 Tax=Leptidea sinapis TaxID=189913 RepID=A0A5E4QJL9_9NEOP|nr:unnamed protein product [Leptidea sinapis]
MLSRGHGVEIHMKRKDVVAWQVSTDRDLLTHSGNIAVAIEIAIVSYLKEPIRLVAKTNRDYFDSENLDSDLKYSLIIFIYPIPYYWLLEKI